MEGDKLYSVKWYRNGKEFYRHIPSDNPPTVVFRQPGLYVDVSKKYNKENMSEWIIITQEYKSTEARIVLRKVKLATAGYLSMKGLP